MPKPKNLIPSVNLNLKLPEDIHGRVMLHLFSAAEGRVPLGAYRQFYMELVQAFFNNKQLDLAPFAGTEPGVCVVSGSPASISVLLKTLKGEVPV